MEGVGDSNREHGEMFPNRFMMEILEMSGGVGCGVAVGGWGEGGGWRRWRRPRAVT